MTERWLWKVIIIGDPSLPRKEWVVADTIDEVLEWVNGIMSEDEAVDSIVRKGDVQIIDPNPKNK